MKQQALEQAIKNIAKAYTDGDSEALKNHVAKGMILVSGERPASAIRELVNTRTEK